MNTIDPEKYYTPSEIAKNKLLPWATNIQTFMTRLKRETSDEIYKPIKITTKTGATRLHIKGQTLIDLLALADEGKLQL